jgi:thiol-disulfide isomerase/thioredoxin
MPTSVAPAIPFCVLTGQTLYNFAANDLIGQQWEYRRDRRGRLVLLDFWGTWCIPCQHAIPHLKVLQQRFGPHGLEVVGIAYEQGSPTEKAQKVKWVRDRLQVNYRLLLGGDMATCPLRTQFAIAGFPTLILLDENGRIIWRAVGLEPQQLGELDAILRQRLGSH